jgi:hypothetical protein
VRKPDIVLVIVVGVVVVVAIGRCSFGSSEKRELVIQRFSDSSPKIISGNA